jgi:hypothetical protein
VCGLFLACGAASAGAAGKARTGPGGGSAPATQPGVKESLADGVVEFSRPADWEEAKKNRTPLRAAWVSPDHKGMILVEVWPEGDINEGTGAKTVAKLRADRKKQAGVKVLMEPAVEKDPRFAMRIHEKYEYTADGTVDDVLRLGRKVGGRVLMVTVWSKSPDDARDKEIHQTGETVMLSATPVKKKK